MKYHPKRLIRITTVPLSLHKLLKGQMHYFSTLGYDVHMVSADGPEREMAIRDEKCPHHIVPMKRRPSPISDLISLFALIRLLYQLKPEIVHTHTPKAGLLGMWAARLVGVPIRIHTVAGLAWIKRRGWKRKVLRFLEKLTLRSANQVLVNSHVLRQFMIDEKIVDPNCCTVLGSGSSNGMDLDYFSRNSNHQKIGNVYRDYMGIGEEARVWLFVGRLVLDKGIVELVDAFLKFKGSKHEDVLWLVGPREVDDSPDRDFFDRLKWDPDIFLWDYQDDIRPFLQTAYALVFPSYREGFPNVPLQAAAMKCPMILSDINGCNELVEHEVNGLLVEPGHVEELTEAMHRFRDNPEILNEFAEKSFAKVKEQYSRENMWLSLKTFYELQYARH